MRAARACSVACAVTLLAASCGISLSGDPDAPFDASAGDASHDAKSEAFGGTGGGFPDAVGEPPAPLPYAYRRRMHITPGAGGVPKGASIRFGFDHASLVGAGKSRADGKDLRVFYKAPSGATEIDRVLDPVSAWNAANTAIWFKAQEAMNQPDGNYYLYYGDPNAGEPLSDANQVYELWDGFDGPTLETGWVGTPIGNSNGTFSVNAGNAHVEGSTGDIWNTHDDFLFLARKVSGDFVADASVITFGGSITGWAKIGGLMLRQTQDPASRNRLVSPVGGSAAFSNAYRLSDGATTAEITENGMNPIPEWVRLTRVQETSRSFHSPDCVNWVEVGTAVSFAQLTDPVWLGIPFANNSGGTGWVEVDWVRIRVYMQEDPNISLDPEEPGPFAP